MSIHLVVRVQESLYDLIRDVAKARGEDVSDLVRRAVKTELARLSYLTPEEKKALGVLKETSPTPKKEGRKK